MLVIANALECGYTGRMARFHRTQVRVLSVTVALIGLVACGPLPELATFGIQSEMQSADGALDMFSLEPTLPPSALVETWGA